MKFYSIEKVKKGYEITKQEYNGKTYSEILKLLQKKEKIADYPLLQKLRNSEYCNELGLNDIWCFVPNPDKMMKDKGFVAWFYAYSGRADLYCNGYPTDSYSSLGVFIIRRKK